MIEGLRRLFGKLVTESSLGRWAAVLTAAHLLSSAVLSYTGRADHLVLMADSKEFLELAGYPLTHGLYSLDGVTSSGKREPGYSGFVMAFMASGIVKPHDFSVTNLWPIAAAQILLYGWICGRIARKLAPVFGVAGCWLGLMIMQATQLAIYQHQLGNECVTMILLGLLALEIACRWRSGPSWGVILRSALWLSLLSITKSVNVLFVPVLSLLLWVRLPVRWPKVVVFFILSLLPAMAWTARNKAVFGLPIMGSIDGFSSLYRANILPYFQISSPEHPAMPEEARRALAACKDDGEKYLWYKQAALGWLKEHPVQYVKQCVHRTAAMFIDLYREDHIVWWKYPFYLFVGNDQLFLTLILMACIVPCWRRQEIWIELSVLFFLFSVGIYGAVYGQERYLHPAFFLLAPVHGWCIVEVLWPRLARWLSERQHPRLSNAHA